MNDEFKKLDQLMERSVPLMAKIVPEKEAIPSRSRRWINYGLSIGLCSFIAFFVVQNNQPKSFDPQAIEEILAWDVTSDEFSEDFEVTMTMIDL